ncbi:MAG: hypothetical protein WAO35_00385 [Terriglobia bacterium]
MMKQLRYMLVVAAGFMVLLVIGSVACGQHGKQQGTPGGQSEKTQAQAETALVQDLISKHKDFDICTVYNIRAVHEVSMNLYPPNVFDAREFYILGNRRLEKLLVDAGYLVPSRANTGWMPTSKLSFGPDQAIQEEHLEGPTWPGTDIRGVPCSVQSARSLKSHFPPFIPYDCDDVYRWTLVAGCREFMSTDATTALSDGLKVDFSWHWKTTDIGTADGLSADRQRGVAYLTKTASGLAIDKIKME